LDCTDKKGLLHLKQQFSELFLYLSVQEKTLSAGDRLLMIEDTSLIGASYEQVSNN